MGRDGKEDELQHRDPRVSWMLQRVISAFKPWLRKRELDRLDDEDTQLALRNFCDDSHAKTLYVCFSGSTPMPVVHTEPPREELQTRKFFYFLKQGAETVARDVEQIPTLLRCGELAPRPLDSLVVAECGVLAALLRSEDNLTAVPDVARQQLLERAHTFRAAVTVAHGAVEARTVLPLPANMSASADVYQLESVVVAWTHHIRKAAALEPTIMFDATYAATKGTPGPLDELAFWQQKAANLLGLERQVSAPARVRVLRTLRKGSSSYLDPFRRLQRELRVAASEACSNAHWLAPLAEGPTAPFQRLGGKSAVDFEELRHLNLFEALFHFAYLLWEHSPYYNTPPRIIVLVRELCNDLIAAAVSYVGGTDLFGDADAAVHRISCCLSVCGQFKQRYFQYKGKASKESSRGPWRFQNTALFGRLDTFLEHCHDLMDVLETAMLFCRLDPDAGRVVIGGTQGAELTAAVAGIHNDFRSAYSDFHSPRSGESFNPINIDDNTFDRHFVLFRERVRMLDRRVAAVLTQAMKDAGTLSALFKVADTFEDFLERASVHSAWLKAQVLMVEALRGDLQLVQEEVAEQVAKERRATNPRSQVRALVAMAGRGDSGLPTSTRDRELHVYDRMPPSARRFVWASGLLGRIEQNKARTDERVSESVRRMDVWSETMRLYDVLQRTLVEYVNGQSQRWAGTTVAAARGKLEKSLLTRDLNKRLHVNFDPSLTCMLKEVTYLQSLSSAAHAPGIEIPEDAQLLHLKKDKFRTQVLKLSSICTTYNGIKENMRPVELPLFEEEIQSLDEALAQGTDELTWESDGMDVFIDNTRRCVDDVDVVTQRLQLNQRSMAEAIIEYQNEDRFFPVTAETAKVSRVPSVSEFTSKYSESKKSRQASAVARSLQVHAVLESSLVALNDVKRRNGIDTVDEGDPRWAAYVGLANDRLRDLVIGSVVSMLSSLRDQLSARWMKENSGMPVLELKLTLEIEASGGHTVQFYPDISSSVGVGSMVLDWARDIVEAASYFNQLDVPSDNFLNDALCNDDVLRLNKEIEDLKQRALQRCDKHKETFEKLEHVWVESPAAAFQAFLTRQQQQQPQSDSDVEDSAVAAPPPPQAPTSAISGAAAEDVEEDNGDAGEDVETTASYLKRMLGRPLKAFEDAVAEKERLMEQVAALPDSAVLVWVKVDSKPLKAAAKEVCAQCRLTYIQHLLQAARKEISDLFAFIRDAEFGLEQSVDGGLESLKETMRWIRDCRLRNSTVHLMLECLGELLVVLRRHPGASDEALSEIESMRRDAPDAWAALYRRSLSVREEHSRTQDQQAEKTRDAAQDTKEAIAAFAEWFNTISALTFMSDTNAAYREMDAVYGGKDGLCQWQEEVDRVHSEQQLFDLAPTEFRELDQCREKLRMLKGIWDMISHVREMFGAWFATPFQHVVVEDLSDEVSKILKQLKTTPAKAREWGCFEGLQSQVRDMALSLPLIQNLREDAMRPRHWAQLFQETDHGSLRLDPRSLACTLRDLMGLGLHKHQDVVQMTVERAMRELQLEQNLARVKNTWETMCVNFRRDPDVSCWMLSAVDEMVEVLDSDTTLLQQMQSNRFIEHFKEELDIWIDHLGRIEMCVQLWIAVQRKWANLYPIFVLSPDIREALPDDARNFRDADHLYRDLMIKASKYERILDLCCSSDTLMRELDRTDNLEGVLQTMKDILRGCERSLAEYLNAKKKLFPRFFFLADADLVDVLSKGSDSRRVMVHMSKIVDAIETFVTKTDDNLVCEFTSVQREVVPLLQPYLCEGPVEVWLGGCIDAMKNTIHDLIDDASSSYLEHPRTTWIRMYPCQPVIVASRVQFTWETHQAFGQLEDGNDSAMRDFLFKQQRQLAEQIGLVLGELTRNVRSMLVHLITVDVHSRDVIQWLIDDRAESDTHFSWQSQLRYYWDEKKGCVIRICDSEFVHGYEYTGICGCLVITKLTDRCYITLTQALRLQQGGAPAGPAGTGKTETTKDLARNLGVACYVFNCSDQMDYAGLGRIFKGLAMSGAWGCFDEFNRISIEVLSVVATQVGSVLHGIRSGKKTFRFAGEELISLVPTCGIFVTMNPGYAGRTELPENIKSLFRPCAMVVPDIQNICEILLAAEGFKEAKDLALKFVQLYRLNSALLSPQAHYDWGLRAVKSVLVVAGQLRRADPDLHERRVLLRALRDTNLAKLSKDDVYVFRSLVRALFPGVEASPKIDERLKACCRVAVQRLDLLSGDGDIFIDKCLQLDELLGVRHSVFVLGPAGSGKTECIRALREAYCARADDLSFCKVRHLNPKAMSADDMYGYAHEQTKEWRDGHLAVIFKEFSVLSKTNSCTKWMVLDGIIDAEWIESMNTVMDDNKMLTLANNDRIPLAPSMRMIFEISQLRNASPATVSRAGVLFINESDLGWGPFKDRWLLLRSDDKERNVLDSLFDVYVQPVMEEWKRCHKPVVPIVDINVLQTLCCFLEFLCADMPQNPTSDLHEKAFCFACVWAFGGPLPSSGRVDYRQLFSKYWVKEMQSRVKICDDKSQVFDFYLDLADGEFKPWHDQVRKFRNSSDAAFSDIVVDTADTVRTGYFVSKMVKLRRPVMLVGTAGTGKTQLITDRLRQLDAAKWATRRVSFNAHTQCRELQSIMEANLERGGRVWHPPRRKQLVFFIDDINMPSPDKYGTQNAIAFLRHFVDYGFWFDQASPGQEKHVVGVQVVSAMNHKSGTFTILDRMMRWFAVFACCMPSPDDLMLIYQSILAARWKGWGKEIQGMVVPLVQATIDLHGMVSEHFLPTAVKFHYSWTMREMYNVVQGLTDAVQGLHEGDMLARLWRHECERTFRDRLVDSKDAAEYDNVVAQVVSKHFGELRDVSEISREPNVWAPFGQYKDSTDVYDALDSYAQLHSYLERRLWDYNQEPGKPPMDLVLFQEAMEHICRICRILHHPRGNALLVGVGGSGKQSLSRLAAFICELDIFQVMVTQTYCGADFARSLADLYIRCGRKNNRFAFIITDSNIVVGEQLVMLNDLLNSGDVPGLFETETEEDIVAAMQPELRQRQHPDFHNTDVCWDFFISKVRANLHVVLCFSPIGGQFGTWCRKFPALCNSTIIDWFHPWPPEALVSVATEFLSAPGSPFADDPEVIANIAEHMSFAHAAVSRVAEGCRAREKLYCYTTPTSYLELIAAYKRLLRDKREAVESRKSSLLDGIQKIRSAQAEVSRLQVQLKEEEVRVREASDECAMLMGKISADKVLCQDETARAELEQEKTERLLGETNALKEHAEADLAAAQPFVDKAKAALKGLDKASLTELKSFSKPPQEVLMVTAAVMCLTADPQKIPRPEQARQWSHAKKMMANVVAWLRELERFGVEQSHNIPQQCVDAVQQWVRHPDFDADRMKTKSEAASCLSSWVTNIDAYHTIRCQVRPKEQRLHEAVQRLETSAAQLARVQERVATLSQKLAGLEDDHRCAVERSHALRAQAEGTRSKMRLAERLVGGLADESVRWARSTDELGESMSLLVGDVLVASAFVSYLGPFSRAHREDLLGQLSADVRARGIPCTHQLDVVYGVLTSEAEVAGWSNEGLPSDRVSTENGAIVKSARRWPLLIDPQLQGVRWIKSRENANGLRIAKPYAADCIDVLTHCMEDGLPCLLENLTDEVDPVLQPVLSKAYVKKGGLFMCTIGDRDVAVDVGSFRLYLQTKSPSPHYKPEMNAQTTFINFTVTDTGLEDQLLAVVVNKERPHLEEKRAGLIRNTNQYKIELAHCEELLLSELSNASGDLLQNISLVDSLEATKQNASMISKALVDNKAAQEEILTHRLVYKTVAVRGSLLYFEMSRLSKIANMYHYSLEAFMGVFNKALEKAPWPKGEDGEEDRGDDTRRVELLMTSITETIFGYVSRGLFQRHKLIFSCLICFAILRERGEIDPRQLDHLITGGKKRDWGPVPEGLTDWCSSASWTAVRSLAELPGPVSPPGSHTQLPQFSSLPEDLTMHNRWRMWAEQPCPEEERLPTDWRAFDTFQRLLVLRCLRPDRLTAALQTFVASRLGPYFVADHSLSLRDCLTDSTPSTPLFFILSPGEDPVRKVEALGSQMGYTYEAGTLHNISLGQGQEQKAIRAVEQCFESGGWVMLSNIHLTKRWLANLERTLDSYADCYDRQAQFRRRRRAERIARRQQEADAIAHSPMLSVCSPQAAAGSQAPPSNPGSQASGAGTHAVPLAPPPPVSNFDGVDSPRSSEQRSQGSPRPDSEPAQSQQSDASEDSVDIVELVQQGLPGHPDLRVFLSAEPGADPAVQIIPIGILQRSIKVTSEPPGGVCANLQRALGEFQDEPWESSSKPTEFKVMLFAMCWFHSVVVERKKFGAQGWNRSYPFNAGDLTSCIDVLANYIEERPHVPWDDLRYVFGEILYGGHITDDWDRRLCSAYLQQLVKAEAVDCLELCPVYSLPHFTTYADAIECATQIPAESPVLYGLHPNAEMGYRIAQAEQMLRTINELHPATTGGADTGLTPQECVQDCVADILANVIADQPHNLVDFVERLEDDRTPQQHVFYQECERMNCLQALVKDTLQELDLGLRGELSMSAPMQAMYDALLLDRVPDRWKGVAFVSLRALGSWCVNLCARNVQLIEWGSELVTPKVTRLDFFFNPMSFLTAIQQFTAMQNSYDLDQMDLLCEPTKRMPEGIDHAARDGAHVFGLMMEGARWETAASAIEDSRLKELYSVLPVATIRALPITKIDRKDQYECPLYKTQARAQGFVVSLWLRTKQPAHRWVIAGVACILDVAE